MGLIERLEKRARELDWQVRSVTKGYYGEPACDYDQHAADDRELLLEASAVIKKLGAFEVLQMVRSGAFR
jgi:hypothetical protein